MSNRIFSKTAPVVLGTGSKADVDKFHAAMQRIASKRVRLENEHKSKERLLVQAHR